MPTATNGLTPPAAVAKEEGTLVRIAIAFTAWAERWFPDAFIFVAIAVVIVALAAIVNGASATAVSRAFGDGFWSLIAFTMQMAFVAIGGYVVATSKPAAWLIGRLAAQPNIDLTRWNVRLGQSCSSVSGSIDNSPWILPPVIIRAFGHCQSATSPLI